VKSLQPNSTCAIVALLFLSLYLAPEVVVDGTVEVGIVPPNCAEVPFKNVIITELPLGRE